MLTQAQIQQVKDLILDNVRKNRVVNVTFRKKTTGELRNMTLMRSKALEDSVKGTAQESVEKRKWTLSQNGMLCCEELTPEKTFQWRTVNLKTLTKVAAAGQVMTFEEA